MENYTFNSLMLQLEGLNFTRDLVYVIFFLFLTFYVVTMTLNLVFLILIIIDKNLHQPMYVLFCNLTVSDIIGGTEIFPRILSDILKPPSERLISYYECVVQAFITQWFSSTSHTVLMAMAFDRYVAICNPLRYSAIMTNKMMLKLTVSAWGVPFIFVVVLIGLSVRLNRCRTLVTNPFCDNASLFKLSCDSVVINNFYGLFYTVLLLVASVGCIVLTYGKIAMVCLTSKNKSLNRKALQTCSTHLVVYLIMSFSGFTVIALHRFPQYSDYRKITSLLFFIVPGSLNTIIYGVQSKEIRKFLLNMFKSNKVLPLKNRK
ncbi:olfactory receptor 1009 [Fundulus heteroclitus]|uniref:olfactory receptor 1009 n=1 Tax=Fundulus heteroclitus TaxID=8078 RepID=UPI00165B302F|nr:olfactory receptor 1009 [Fundulus heteroclitus]